MPTDNKPDWVAPVIALSLLLLWVWWSNRPPDTPKPAARVTVTTTYRPSARTPLPTRPRTTVDYEQQIRDLETDHRIRRLERCQANPNPVTC